MVPWYFSVVSLPFWLEVTTGMKHSDFSSVISDQICRLLVEAALVSICIRSANWQGDKNMDKWIGWKMPYKCLRMTSHKELPWPCGQIGLLRSIWNCIEHTDPGQTLKGELCCLGSWLDWNDLWILGPQGVIFWGKLFLAHLSSPWLSEICQ